MHSVAAAHMRASIKDTEDAQINSGNRFYKMLGVVTTILLGLGVYVYLGMAR